jgi:hypothetical protein
MVIQLNQPLGLNGGGGDYGLRLAFEHTLAGVEPDTQKKLITKGLWAANLGELLTFFTSSAQSSDSKTYHYEIWSSASLVCGDENMFSVAYGHVAGSGSMGVGGQIGDTPTRAIYSQYKTMLLEGDPTLPAATGAPTRFTLANGSSVQHFYAVNISRDRFEDKLDPGNFELVLAKMDSAASASALTIASANNVIRLIDDSADTNDSLGYGGLPSNVRNLVSGSISDGIYNPSAPHYYGLVYSDKGVILLDADVLNTSASLGTVTGSNVIGNNAFRLYKSISGSGAQGAGYGFSARSVSVKDVTYYYVRVPARLGTSLSNTDAGGNSLPLAMYSNNPTYVSSSNNVLTDKSFINDPTVYVTSIGMYDDEGELLAIAKMSKPIKKTLNSELSVTVRLEY